METRTLIEEAVLGEFRRGGTAPLDVAVGGR
jgi:hypothetical protein